MEAGMEAGIVVYCVSVGVGVFVLFCLYFVIHTMKPLSLRPRPPRLYCSGKFKKRGKLKYPKDISNHPQHKASQHNTQPKHYLYCTATTQPTLEQIMPSHQMSAGSGKAAKFVAANPLGPMADPFAGMVRRATRMSLGDTTCCAK